MIDLHCHMLPGCDDGAKDLSISLRLAQEAVSQGVDKILLTPHHMDGKYINHKSDVIKRTEQFQKQLNEHRIPLTVYPGQEVHLTGQLIKAIDDDDILFADANHHYLMLELPSTEVPAYMPRILFQLQSRRITPVIVHPERNNDFMHHPDKLYQLVEKGCLTQLTATSYVGEFGKKVQRFSNKIISANLGSTFSSDAHNLHHRKIMMKPAYDSLIKNKGSELSNKYQKDAQNILLGNVVNTNHINKISKDNKLKSFIKKIF